MQTAPAQPREGVTWDPFDPPVWLPTADEVEERLEQILTRGSVTLGAQANTERLMLMLTRSCELRCGYCFVDKTETGQEMDPALARRGVDLIMRSSRARLEVQFFGGEPTRRWDVLSGTMQYAWDHPLRRGRAIDYVVTTNGMGFDPERVAFLERFPVMVLFSLDGDREAHRRFRQSHLTTDDAAYDRIHATLGLLRESRLRWFMNVTMAPRGAEQVFQRYLWAREQGVRMLQLNYSVGHYWNPEQEARYLTDLQRALYHHAAYPDGLVLFNWRSDCEPVMLSNDLIVDVDGTVLHDGAIFLERSLPALKRIYRRGHLDEVAEFDPLRWSLRELHDNMTAGYAEQPKEIRYIRQNIRMGAAVDLIIRRVQGQLGRLCPRMG